MRRSALEPTKLRRYITSVNPLTLSSSAEMTGVKIGPKAGLFTDGSKNQKQLGTEYTRSMRGAIKLGNFPVRWGISEAARGS